MSNMDADEEAWLTDDDDDDAAALAHTGARPWRLLIVDDEPDIHSVTRLALNKLQFKGRSIDILSAYSGAQGFEMLSREPDIALVLLDVVMETEDAGLQLARRIREELHNNLVRIVLRTGQPGQAPEQRVIVEFDINDYKAKTELTSQKLFTTVITSLRGYEGLQTIEAHRKGLSKILEAASNLYHIASLKELASGVLTQVGAILDFGTDGVLCVMQQKGAQRSVDPMVIASTGDSVHVPDHMNLPASHAWAPVVHRAFAGKASVFEDAVNVLYIDATHGRQFAVAFAPPWPMGPMERDLLKVFCDQIAAAFDNLHLFGLLKTSHQATVMALVDLAESHDVQASGHVGRVCQLSEAMAAELRDRGRYTEELTPEFVSLIGVASMMHDVGKATTPDTVLRKPGPHTPDERTVMQGHVLAGETVLARAAAGVEGMSTLSMAAEIAGGHHEHFDGNGYPRGLKGDAIALSARIVAVVDVYDALMHHRAYDQAWSRDKVLAHLQERRGTQFDPEMVDVLLAVLARQEQPQRGGGV